MTDRIITHPANDAYRNGFDAIFGKKQDSQDTRTSDSQVKDEHKQAGGESKV